MKFPQRMARDLIRTYCCSWWTSNIWIARTPAIVAESEPLPRAVIFDLGAQESVDVTSQEITKSLFNELQRNGIAIYLADVHAPVLEISSQSGLLDIVGKDHVFPTVDAAVRFIEKPN